MGVEQEKLSLRSRLFNFRGLYDSSGGGNKHTKSLSLDDSSTFDDPIIITASTASTSSSSTDDNKDGHVTHHPSPLEKQKSRVVAAAAAIGRAMSRNDRGSRSHLNRDQDVVAQLLKDKMHEMDQMKERFSKLLLGEDMSGGGKGVSSALALSNAITNLAASVFGEQWRLEPMSTERKTRWRREIDLLLTVTDHIVEFVAAQQAISSATINNLIILLYIQIMVTRQRNDLLMNIPALRKLDAMLIVRLEINIQGKGQRGKKRNGGYQLSKYLQMVFQNLQGDSFKSKRTQSIKFLRLPWLSMLKSCQKWKFLKATLNHFPRYLTNPHQMQLINLVLSFCFSPMCWIWQNGRISLGDSAYKNITVECFDPDQFLSTMDLSSEHKILDLKDRIEASIVIWKRKMNQKDGKSAWASGISIEKREVFEERAETILIIMKQRFPGIPQSALDISKIESNRDVGQAILESYSRILESLAFTVLSRIEDVLYSDHCAKNPNQVGPKRRSLSQGDTPTEDDEESSAMTLLDFMGWEENDGDDGAGGNSEDIQKEDAKVSEKLGNVDTTNKPSYLATLVGSRSPTSRD
ncbi:Rop guanine nucleotide exchange factor 12 [Linum perenne]